MTSPAPVTSSVPVTATTEAPSATTPVTATATPAEVAKEIRKLKLKVDGQEQELPEDEVIRLAQMGKSAGKKYDEAAQLRKQAESFFEMLKDPAQLKKVLTDPRIGVDVKKWAEEYVWEQMQEEQLSPDQKKQRDDLKELEKYRRDQKAQKEHQEKQEQEAILNRDIQNYDQKVTAALEAGGIPRTKATVARMANYMIEAVKKGYELEFSDLTQLVRQDYINEARELFGNLPGDQLEAFLGSDVGKKLRDHDLGKLKNTQQTSFNQPRAKQAADNKGNKPTRLSSEEYRKSVLAKFRK